MHISKKIGSVFLAILLVSMFVGVESVQATCATNLNCIIHQVFVLGTVCLYPDACNIHVNSLWYSPGVDLYYGPGRRLAEKILVYPYFTENINAVIESKIKEQEEDIICIPVGDSTPVNIFKIDDEKLISKEEFLLAEDPELFLSFGHYNIFNLRIPCGLPQGDLVKYIKNFRCCEAASPWRNTLWSCHRDSQGEGNFLLMVKTNKLL